MKFVISLLFTFKALAAPILINHEGNLLEASMFKDIMISEYSIPEDLIVMKQISQCEEIKNEGKLNICLKNNGDLLLVSVDRGFVDESLKVFQAP